ncbi:hypothetical protein [Chryseobacterium caseinilyticum]|uniref:Lipoprotein n=1 Tax=Chryseobacterium caseinilyticum TaxID=2771428 RepID=A0ABR8Z6F9_9FLAO|nr:hypothetical protein [Chryseobacterium caseinilyticum]MBD8080874.1 hypothetical protein [Chryseobacterium caseinilyticum]
MKKILLFLPLLFLIFSCENNKIEKVENAFYYWKSDDYPTSDNNEKDILINQNIKKLYVKFFEVDYTDAMGSFPVSKTGFSLNSYCDVKSKGSYEIIPTVYIKNIVFQKSNEKDLDKLADNVNFLVKKIFKRKFRIFESLRNTD